MHCVLSEACLVFLEFHVLLHVSDHELKCGCFLGKKKASYKAKK